MLQPGEEGRSLLEAWGEASDAPTTKKGRMSCIGLVGDDIHKCNPIASLAVTLQRRVYRHRCKGHKECGNNPSVGEFVCKKGAK